jgi:hypothetical protein
VVAIQAWPVWFPASELEAAVCQLAEWAWMIEVLVVAARRICNFVLLRI